MKLSLLALALASKQSLSSAKEVDPNRDLQETVEGYDYVGVGYCEGSNWNINYGRVSFASSSNGDCGDSCKDIVGLVGFSLSYGTCECFTHEDPLSAPVSGADGCPEASCYKVAESTSEPASTSRLSVYQGKSVVPQTTCGIDKDTNEATCDFDVKEGGAVLATAIPGTSFDAKIETGECSGTGPTVDISDTARTTVTTNSLAPEPITAAEKNCEPNSGGTLNGEGKCEVTRKFCARADLFDVTDGPVSVLAGLAEVTATYIFDKDGTFDVTVSTAEFNPETATADDTRTAEIGAYHCNDDGTHHGGTAMRIGEQLHICVYPKDDDVSIDISSMDLKYVDLGGTLITITSPVGIDPVAGTANFVTAIAPMSNVDTIDDGTKTVQKVSTLLVPSIFDTAGGQQIIAAGTVAVTYGGGRKLLKIRTLQADAEEPFAVSFDIEENDVPAIAQVDESSGAIATAIGGAGAMAAVFAGALFMN